MPELSWFRDHGYARGVVMAVRMIVAVGVSVVVIMTMRMVVAVVMMVVMVVVMGMIVGHNKAPFKYCLMESGSGR